MCVVCSRFESHFPLLFLLDASSLACAIKKKKTKNKKLVHEWVCPNNRLCVNVTVLRVCGCACVHVKNCLACICMSENGWHILSHGMRWWSDREWSVFRVRGQRTNANRQPVCRDRWLWHFHFVCSRGVWCALPVISTFNSIWRTHAATTGKNRFQIQSEHALPHIRIVQF